MDTSLNFSTENNLTSEFSFTLDILEDKILKTSALPSSPETNPTINHAELFPKHPNIPSSNSNVLSSKKKKKKKKKIF